MLPWEQIETGVQSASAIQAGGKVTRVGGLLIEGILPNAKLGMLCRLPIGGAEIPAEVVALKGTSVSLMPLARVPGIVTGTSIIPGSCDPSVPVGKELIGRVLNGWGEPIDGKGAVECHHRYPLHPSPLNPMARGAVTDPLPVGIKAIDGVLTCGAGQRLVIMAGAGVGKSTLLSMMARNTEADVTVLALIGERSREVKAFVEKDLGPEGLKRAVVVASTSNTSVALRIRAAFLAMTVAEYFRDQGKRVLLLVDSLTRICMAQRELGLAIGEPPTTRGYPPSSFAIIPQLLERAGPGLTESGGSITGFFTSLLELEDVGDPISEAIRAVTDGHIVLDRKLADRGHFPAIDVLASTSRVMPDISDEAQLRLARAVRRGLSDLREAEELITFGAYHKGAVPRFDRALVAKEMVEAFLTQGVSEKVDMNTTAAFMAGLAEQFDGSVRRVA
jgi:flagellum-specific ATP synthase